MNDKLLILMMKHIDIMLYIKNWCCHWKVSAYYDDDILDIEVKTESVFAIYRTVALVNMMTKNFYGIWTQDHSTSNRELKALHILSFWLDHHSEQK